MGELVLVKKEDGITEKKAKEITALYKPMLAMLETMEENFNDLVSQDITAELIPAAKRLRLDIAQVRITADRARETAKAEYTRAGNAIQGAYNTLLYAVKSKEDKLKAIENHFEEMQRAEQAKLQETRTNEMVKYGDDIENLQHIDLGAMPEEVWNNYLLGTKTSYEAQKEAEAVAEKARLAAEKQAEIDRLAKIKEQERITAENAAKLKAAEAIAKKAAAEQKVLKDKLAKQEADAKAERERVAEVAEKEKERLAKLAEAEKQRLAKIAEAAKAAQDKKDEIAAKAAEEKQAKIDKLQKEKDDAAAEAEAKLNQGDAANKEDLIADLSALKAKYEFKSVKNIRMYNGVKVLLDKVVNHIESL